MNEPAMTAAAEPELQFERAELPSGAKGALACSICTKPVETDYFQLNGSVTCPRCLAAVREALTRGSGPGRYVRACLFGGLAAVAGALLTVGVAVVLGYPLSLMAIVVGIMVGKAVRRGCRARGGWPYQSLAVFLTYCGFICGFVPGMLLEMKHDGKLAAKHSATSTQAAKNPPASPSGPGASPASAHPTTAEENGGARTRAGEPAGGKALLMLLSSLFFLPIVLAFSGHFFLAIVVGYGLYEAWQINRPLVLNVTGPWTLGRRAQVAAP